MSLAQSIAFSITACWKGVQRQGGNEIPSTHLSSECVPQRNPPQPSRYSSHITLVPTPIAIINGLCFACYIPFHIISKPNLPKKKHVSLILSFLSNTQITFTSGQFSIRLFPYSSYSIITFFTYILWKAGGVFSITKCTYSSENAPQQHQTLFVTKAHVQPT